MTPSIGATASMMLCSVGRELAQLSKFTLVTSKAKKYEISILCDTKRINTGEFLCKTVIAE
jgi:hypothetical protein